jgi:AraC-like DNA-binding protein
VAVRAPTIASGAIRKLLDALESEGVDPAPMLADVGLEAALVADQDGRVPLERLHALWEAAVRAMPRMEAAVVGAERYAPGDYGLVGFVAMNSTTLGEAIRHAVRYLGLWTDDPGIELHDDGTLTVFYRTRFADRLGLRLATEATPAELLNGARVVTQKRITPLAVRFAHPAPADTSAHRAFFGCPLEFGAPDNAMRLEPADLALCLPKADAQLGAYLRSLANQALERRGGSEPGELGRIRGIIAEELQRGVPTQSVVAQRLATSERTLRRRLEAEGTSFRALLDGTRAELAKNYVRDRSLPLSEVAFLLGFSEPSAFHRAFKRWTDSTPSAWRARA